MDMGELRTKLAAIEHERWSAYMRYFLGKLEPTEGGRLVPQAYYDNLLALAHTAFSDLSDKLRAADVGEVDRYWPLVEDMAKLAEYLHYQGTSCKEVLEQLEGDWVIAHKDDMCHEDRMGAER